DPYGRATSIVDRDLSPSGAARTTTYDAFGEPVAYTDGMGVTTTISYDALGRPTSRNAADGTDTWMYDTAVGPGIAKLAWTSRGNAVEAAAYEPHGHVSARTWAVDGASYDFAYGYDEFGRLSRMLYPQVAGRARFEIDPIYDAAGHVQSLHDERNHTIW